MEALDKNAFAKICCDHKEWLKGFYKIFDDAHDVHEETYNIETSEKTHLHISHPFHLEIAQVLNDNPLVTKIMKQAPIKFKRGDLCGAKIYSQTIINKCFTGMRLNGTSFSSCIFINCNFDSITFNCTEFFDCQFVECYFYGSSFSYVNIKVCKFSDCEFMNFSSYKSKIVRSKFIDSAFQLGGIKNEGNDFSGTQFIDTPISWLCNESVCTNLPVRNSICPSTGEFIGWKKVHAFKPGDDGFFWCDALVKLQILSDSKRSNSLGRKCRCDKAKVLDITVLDDEELKNEKIENLIFCSDYDPDFKYVIGQLVQAPDFDENPFHECAPGIHFFITKEEAEDYNI